MANHQDSHYATNSTAMEKKHDIDAYLIMKKDSCKKDETTDRK